MRTSRELIHDFEHQRPYSPGELRLPTNAQQFAGASYLELCELYRKCPEHYHWIANAAKDAP